MRTLQGESIDYDAVWPASSLWLTAGDTQYRVKHTQSISITPVVFGIRQSLAEELGFSNWRDFPALRAACGSLSGDPRLAAGAATILETEHLLFVHGGVPSREHMETLNRWKCMKNDNFWGRAIALTNMWWWDTGR